MPVAAVSTLGKKSPAKHCVLKCYATALRIPITELASPHSNLTGNWVTANRPEQKPLIGRNGQKLEQLQLTATLVHRRRARIQTDDPGDVHSSVRAQIDALVWMSWQDEPVTISWGDWESRSWHITDLTINPQRRAPDDNRIVQAQAVITLTEAVPEPGPTATKKRKKKHSDGKQRTYTVKAGDTISGIALKFYGDANDWHRIAKANHLRHPHKLKAGQRLVIPA